ncbi:MAG TPA: hypothetical protein VMS86_07085 [Thermoanaerobaculia bacterium]|nr:hypothetical protein [Thermoanaerobaculia bacterium]
MRSGPLAAALAAVLAATGSAANAEAKASGSWSAGTVVEPETVEELTAALVQSSAGLVLAIAREPGGTRVLGILRLPPTDQDFLDDSRSPALGVDDGPRFEPRRLGSSLKSVSFVLWDGVGEPVLGLLRDLMDARRRIVVAYPLAGGGYKEVELPVAGARAAIARVLGVAEEVAPEARELAAARQEAVERCLAEEKSKLRDRCLERLAGCAEAATGEELRACVSDARK